MTTVGAGTYTYTEIQDWARLPPGETFAYVSAVATDSQDRVYAFQRKDPPVVVFDRDGRFLSSWGNGAFLYAHGFFIADNIVYLVDRDSSVCMLYTLDGKPIQMLGRHGVHSDTGCEHPVDLVPHAAGPFNYPSEMVVAPSGDLYVSDGYRNARVHRFSWDGNLKASWGEGGKTAPGQFHLPHSLIVAHERVYVCDRENHRVQIFSLDGDFLEQWTDFERPMDIAVDRDGVLYVSEGGLEGRTPPRVSVLDRDGKLLARFNSRGSAHGCWVDSHGDIYVALGGGAGVDKFVRQR
jgi:DNA-binding beta-propeller fold protein YncE